MQLHCLFTSNSISLPTRSFWRNLDLKCHCNGLFWNGMEVHTALDGWRMVSLFFSGIWSIQEESGMIIEESGGILEESGGILEESGGILEESGGILEEFG